MEKKAEQPRMIEAMERGIIQALYIKYNTWHCLVRNNINKIRRSQRKLITIWALILECQISKSSCKF